jgi:hypothetical protein
MWAVKRLSGVVSGSSVDASGSVGGECRSQCSFGERRSVSDEILTSVIAGHRRTPTHPVLGQRYIFGIIHPLRGNPPTGGPQTSVTNYHYSLRNNPEERSSQVYITYIYQKLGLNRRK